MPRAVVSLDLYNKEVEFFARDDEKDNAPCSLRRVLGRDTFVGPLSAG